MADSPATAPVAIRYRAFLSYGHADTAWAKWLHRALERFHIDKDLVGRETPLGPVPKALRPIFRDREDFSGGASLTDATLAALDASAALIVLCSTVAATRPAVNEEVRLFRSRHPTRPVIPVVIEGTYPDNFPPALRHELAPDGSVTDRPVTILGPDLRDSADGKTLGLAKCVAGLLGVNPDDVFRRAERARRRQARFRNAVVGALALLAVAASGSAVYAWHQLKTNEAFLDATLDRFTSLVNRSVTAAQSYSLPLSVTLGLLEEAEGLLQVMAQYGRETPRLKYRQAVMLLAFADNYRDLGRTDEWQRRVAQARRILDDLVRNDPDNVEWAGELARAHDSVGDLLAARGDLASALRDYQAGHVIASRLAKADPNNTGWQRSLALSYERIGDVLVEQGNLTDALASFRASLAIRQRLVEADPSNATWQRDLAFSHTRIGDVLLARGNLTDALASYRASLAINERLTKADPNNASSQRNLAIAYEKIANVLVAQGNLTDALASFRAALAINERLTKTDPNNTAWQRDLSVSYHGIGDVLLTQGNVNDALASFRAGLAINERLTKADPNNADWQRNLSVFYDTIGDVLVAQGNFTDALASFRAGLAIKERLTKADPTIPAGSAISLSPTGSRRGGPGQCR